MNAQQLDLYFKRIYFSPSSLSQTETLKLIHVQHLRNIAFESLDPFLKRPVDVSPDAVFNKLVSGGRGGYCFEHNQLLADALSAAGFTVTPHLARISRPGFGFGGYSHRLNLVHIGSERYIADVGYGGDGLLEPLILSPGLIQVQPFNTYRVVTSDAADFVIQIKRPDDSFEDMIAFNERPSIPDDFVIASFYTSAHPHSFFAAFIICVLHTPSGKRTLMGDKLTVLHNGLSETSELPRDKLPAALQDLFNINTEGLDL